MTGETDPDALAPVRMERRSRRGQGGVALSDKAEPCPPGSAPAVLGTTTRRVNTAVGPGGWAWVSEVATPCAIVELPVLERNAEAMRARAGRLGVALRPHVKTHKCVETARIQTAGLGPITVSTALEGECFAAAGFTDILLAVPPAPAFAGRLAALARRVRHFAVVLDDRDTTAALATAAATCDTRIGVLLEVDCGHHRTGIDPDDADAVRFAGELADEPGLEWCGILTHAGQAYGCRNAVEAKAVAAQERAVMVAFAERLGSAGVPVPEVSVGSTPTAVAATSLVGVSEIRPGNYAYFDAFQAAIGSCTIDDCAFSVLATVISRHGAPARIVVDAGALALSKDEGPRHVDAACGYGVVTDARTRLPIAGARIESLSQEHGVIRLSQPFGDDEWPLGARLRIVPNHSCLAAAMFDRVFVVAGPDLIDEWRPVRGWQAD